MIWKYITQKGRYLRGNFTKDKVNKITGISTVKGEVEILLLSLNNLTVTSAYCIITEVAKCLPIQINLSLPNNYIKERMRVRAKKLKYRVSYIFLGQSIYFNLEALL